MLVEVERLGKRIGGREVVKNINIFLDAGEKLNIYGPHGSGKTVLLKLLVDLLVRDTGVVRIDGLDPLNHRKEVLRRTAYIPQEKPLAMKASRNVVTIYSDVLGFGEHPAGELRDWIVRARISSKPRLILIDSIDTLSKETVDLVSDYIMREGAGLISTSVNPDNSIEYDYIGLLDDGALYIEPVMR